MSNAILRMRGDSLCAYIAANSTVQNLKDDKSAAMFLAARVSHFILRII